MYAPETMLKEVSEDSLNIKSLRKTAVEFFNLYQMLRERISGEINPENYGRETLFKEEELGLAEFTEVMA
ncbi:hypothetical protein DPMN_116820 [Dreissena polymorpha]|uniref:Uncharacterized protein n=1 Tax=Dreissena polymorpha TaxID=45954 RepID=A0A9D4KP87_DREPO|nr:hypothetical protein DPMN_116820 [Dreissena polymorpha]